MKMSGIDLRKDSPMVCILNEGGFVHKQKSMSAKHRIQIR